MRSKITEKQDNEKGKMQEKKNRRQEVRKIRRKREGINVTFSCFLLLASCFLLLAPLHASSGNRGTSACNFLKLGFGARPSGMGEAFSAVDGDINTVYWNPAGLYSLDKFDVSFMYLDWFARIDYHMLSFAMPIKNKMSFGTTVGLLDYGETEKTIEATGGGYGGTVGTYSAYDRELKLSFAYLFDFDNWILPVGLNLKYLYQKIDLASASGGAVDFGLQFRLKKWEHFSFGLVLQNIGTMSSFDLEKDPLPFNVKGGILFSGFRDKLHLVSDVNIPRDNTAYINLGAEYYFLERADDLNFALRAGYSSLKNRTDREGFTLGAGFSYKDLEIDYAFLPFELLGNTHRVSINYQFGPSRGKKIEELKAKLALKEAEAEEIKEKIIKKEPKEKPEHLITFVTDDGEAIFVFQDRGFKKVGVAGDFNNWDYTKNIMKLESDFKWRTKIKLEEGRYKYKFVVNDLYWIEDKNNKNRESDGIGGYHSVIEYYKEKGPASPIIEVTESTAIAPPAPEPKPIGEAPASKKKTKKDFLDSALENINNCKYEEALRDIIEVMKMDPMDEDALSMSIRIRKVIRIMKETKEKR
ncbi:MAG: PorV/PorQ family protein [Candidatus Hydrogenedentota bacterium]